MARQTHTQVFEFAKEPKTPLGYRRILSPTAGVRVSPLCLGGMSLGHRWGDFLGDISKEDAFKLLDAFVEAGGNFIDLANLYHFGDSELWVGEWMELRGNREQMVIATKYSGWGDEEGKDVNAAGNHSKSMAYSLKQSLKRLRTDYVDILYVHFWDYTTSYEEVMRGLHRFVMNGQILYPAISDTPAWIVVKCNDFARANSLSPFVLYQGRYALTLRDLEQDVIPMLRAEGMGLAPWGVLGQGTFMSKKQIEDRKASGEKLRGEQSETDIKVSETLEKIAGEIGGGATVTSVALAWMLVKIPYIFPIIGGRKIEHLHDNIKALSHNLSEKQMQELEAVKPLELLFPHSMISQDPHYVPGSTTLPTGQTNSKVQFVQTMIPVKPSQ